MTTRLQLTTKLEIFFYLCWGNFKTFKLQLQFTIGLAAYTSIVEKFLENVSIVEMRMVKTLTVEMLMVNS